MQKLNRKDIIGALFEVEIEKKSLFLTIGWVALFYAIGLLLWGILFNWRHTPLNYHDWEHINLPRIQVIKEALQTSQLPLHVADKTFLHNLTDRYLALPDIITTPHMVLLWFVDGDTFILLDLLLLYTIATAGLIYFKRRYNLSLFVYAVLFFLFNFNGYIQSHYVVGHVTWGGYFLFPWFFILVFEFIEGRPDWRWVAKMALLSFYIVLAGSQHHFTWMMLFLGFLGLACWKKLHWVLAAVFASGFLSAIRLAPAVLIVTQVKDRPAFQFQSGYVGLIDWLFALVQLRLPDFIVPGFKVPLGYWEFDYYIGIIGALVVITFGLIFWIRDQSNQRRFSALFIPFIMTFLFSTGVLYGYTFYNLPVFASERVISRMVSIPMTLLMLIASIYFHEWLEKHPQTFVRWLVFAGLGFLLNDILTHMRFWNVQVLSRQFTRVQLQFNQAMLANHPDPLYTNLLLAALAVTLLTFVFLMFMAFRSGVKNR